MGSRECRRTQQAASKTRAFFVCPIDDTYRNRRTAVMRLCKPAQRFQSRHHAKATVEPSAVRHGIQVTTQDQSLVRFSGERDPMIPRRVVMMLDRKTGQLR